jgi:hypothetical protein
MLSKQSRERLNKEYLKETEQRLSVLESKLKMINDTIDKLYHERVITISELTKIKKIK